MLYSLLNWFGLINTVSAGFTGISRSSSVTSKAKNSCFYFIILPIFNFAVSRTENGSKDD
jgi:hypothetical protein